MAETWWVTARYEPLLERPTDILSEQERSAAMAVGDGCGAALTVAGIVMLAKRLKEFVFQA